ncbi:hypothetical protein STCU_11585 [Strigomonas culicis]|uniref:Uncharacterized protein n=1 Tax=Strigomonas culicis TaxID=28005 RepID=S9TI83_9TRYP|nr:hypothetical protein STCU_11585 [Strigomonas culicis]|eukprot:EPY16048.1 hypothetical protein STCU_11585 [Strigomonas culicis]
MAQGHDGGPRLEAAGVLPPGALRGDQTIPRGRRRERAVAARSDEEAAVHEAAAAADELEDGGVHVDGEAEGRRRVRKVVLVRRRLHVHLGAAARLAHREEHVAAQRLQRGRERVRGRVRQAVPPRPPRAGAPRRDGETVQRVVCEVHRGLHLQQHLLVLAVLAGRAAPRRRLALLRRRVARRGMRQRALHVRVAHLAIVRVVIVVVVTAAEAVRAVELAAGRAIARGAVRPDAAPASPPPARRARGVENEVRLVVRDHEVA